MYRCTDCSKIYENPPQYCDCGNNRFEKIAQSPRKADTSRKNSFFSEIKARISRISFEQKISVLIFVFLLALSVIPWLIPAKTVPRSADKQPVPAKKEIPLIDELWLTPSGQQETVEEPEPVQERIIEVIKQVYVPAPQAKTAPSPEPVSKKVQKPVQKTVQKSNPAPKTAQPQPSKPTAKPVQKIVQKPAQLSAQEKKELENYKGALRMALFNNLNVPSIQGAGECAVEFNVDSSGKLTNRNFAYQSDNKSLNDAVYYMLMRVPRFSAPPASYKGEKIKLRFRYANGSIEVSFIQ